MKVCEIFSGIQGEGLRTGQKTTFIRFAGCNLRCQFCDTKYSWKESKEISVSRIIKKVKKLEVDSVTLTGGEPLIQNLKDLKELVNKLHENSIEVNIETNGLIFDFELFRLIDFWSISPKIEYFEKLSHYQNRVNTYVLTQYFSTDLKMQLKFVLDFYTIKLFRNLLYTTYLGDKILESTIPIIVQPKTLDGDNVNNYLESSKQLLEELNKDLKNKNFRFLLQQHRLLYNNKRGV